MRGEAGVRGGDGGVRPWGRQATAVQSQRRLECTCLVLPYISYLVTCISIFFSSVVYHFCMCEFCLWKCYQLFIFAVCKKKSLQFAAGFLPL